jgi:hypothetical protein
MLDEYSNPVLACAASEGERKVEDIPTPDRTEETDDRSGSMAETKTTPETLVEWTVDRLESWEDKSNAQGALFALHTDAPDRDKFRTGAQLDFLRGAAKCSQPRGE